jgi:hypothetical protein
VTIFQFSAVSLIAAGLLLFAIKARASAPALGLADTLPGK